MKDVSFWVQSGQNGCDCQALPVPEDHADESAASFLRCERRIHQNWRNWYRDMGKVIFAACFLVLQDTWLFSGSIFENIRYGSLTARKDEVVDAAKWQISTIIFLRWAMAMTLWSMKSPTIFLREKTASHNRKSYFKNPRILILDEATSAVDTRLERMLQDAMQKVAARANLFCHCPPAFNDTQCRPDPGRR